jgi:hypothetical protein
LHDLLSHAEKERQSEPARADYCDGYIRGLHRGHFGHDAGLDEEHEWQIEESDAYAHGHRDGYHAGLTAETGRG